MTERKEKIIAAFNWLGHFLNERLWDEDLLHYGGFRGFFLRELRIMVVVARNVPRGQIPLRAAAMTLATLFAIIPGIVLVFTLVGSFGGFEGIEAQLQEFILKNLVTTVQEQASEVLRDFLEGVRSGTFRGVSFIFLLGTVLFLLGAIEQAFNQIWGIKRGRGLAHRLTTYTTIAVLGPFFVGLSLTMTASLQNAEALAQLSAWAPAGAMLRFLFSLGPLLVTILGLTVIYMVMPNTRVRFISAFASAVTAGLVWEISKWGYGFYLSSATMYRSLYGSLTAIPLLFLWIQFSWVIVLFGALLTFAREAADDFRLEVGAVDASFRARLGAALRCMLAICRKHARGCTAPTVAELAAELHIPVRLARTAVGELLGGGLLHEVVRQLTMGEGGLVPAKDLQNLTVFDVVTCLQNTGTSPPPATGTRVDQEVERILGKMDRCLADLGRPLTFAQLVAAAETSAKERDNKPPVELVERS